MIVDRRVFQVKKGCMEDVLNMLKDAFKRSDNYTEAYRIYVPDVAEFDCIAVEWEFKDYQDMQAAWAAVPEKALPADFWETWNALTEPGGRREIWELAASR